MIKLLIVDDHPMFRRTLRAILESQRDMVVVGEAGNGIEAIKQAKNLQPDIILMDVEMPEMNGMDATLQIHATYNDIKIIALSSHAEHAYVEQMMIAGATDYLPKGCSRADLINCIHLVWDMPERKVEKIA